jgi:hypothetical protein
VKPTLPRPTVVKYAFIASRPATPKRCANASRTTLRPSASGAASSAIA